MGMINIIEWYIFNGRCPSRKEHAMMQNCSKLLGRKVEMQLSGPNAMGGH